MIGVLRWVGFGPQVPGILGFRRPAAEPLAFVRGSRDLGQQRVLMDGPRPRPPASARLRLGTHVHVRSLRPTHVAKYVSQEERTCTFVPAQLPGSSPNDEQEFRRGVRLAIDWGDARIGVAACDSGGVLAYPLTTVRAGADEIGELMAVVAEHEPIEVLVGLPRSLSGGRARLRQRRGSGLHGWRPGATYRSGW